MTYKVIGKNDLNNIQKCIFENRGVKDYKTYTHLDESCVIPYQNLDNINEAVELFCHHIDSNSKITIIQDSDADGICSAAMMYDYIMRIDGFAEVNYLIHTSKQHGISDELEIPEDTQFLIIPDAGTNDTEQCKALKEKGIDILILDHHIKDVENPYAVIVNNQMSENYPNKDLCGAGIVYKFLQAVDYKLWNEYADYYLDLVALANISDVMDIRTYETKYLISKGLKQIVNKGFEGLCKSQEYSTKGKINIRSVAFYITPLINAVCRCGTQEEKEMLFKAFLEIDEEYDYRKKNKETGEYEIIKESIYERAARTSKNVKSRQDKLVQKLVPEVMESIEKKEYDKKYPIIFARADFDGGFSGLVAIKLAEYYKRPVLILRKTGEDEYRGSARANNDSPIASLKNALTDLNLFNFCAGHDNAFGLSINKQNIPKAMKSCLDKFKDIDFTQVSVDFDMDFSDLNIAFIKDINDLSDYYGTGIKEPLVYIKNIELIHSQGVLMGKDKSTWKFINDDNIAFLKFKNTETDAVLNFLDSERIGVSEDNSEDDSIFINALCKVGISEYAGVSTPQVEIIKYEVAV